MSEPCVAPERAGILVGDLEATRKVERHDVVPLCRRLKYDPRRAPGPGGCRQFVDNDSTQPASPTIGGNGHSADLGGGRIERNDRPRRDNRAGESNNDCSSVTIRRADVDEVWIQGLVDVSPVLTQTSQNQGADLVLVG